MCINTVNVFRLRDTPSDLLNKDITSTPFFLCFSFVLNYEIFNCWVPVPGVFIKWTKNKIQSLVCKFTFIIFNSSVDPYFVMPLMSLKFMTYFPRR